MLAATGSKFTRKWEVWTQKDGTEISVGDMDEAHLRNTLNMLLRKRREAIETRFKQELRKEIKRAFPEEYWRD